MITCLALACGVTAIRFAIDGQFDAAVMAIIIAMLLDAIDGRVARAMQGSSPFGAELDSLADLINFGVAPGMIVWLSFLHVLGNTGWLFVVCFAIACGVRLARFNVTTSDPGAPAWKSKYFTGVNAPAGAALAMVPFYLEFSGLVSNLQAAAPYIAVYLAVLAVLMVSRVPTFSFKTSQPGWLGKTLLGAGGMGALLGAFDHPWHVLLAGALIYLCLIPISIMAYRRDVSLQRDDAAGAHQPMVATSMRLP
jgi:CDP-diacylglycerol--serine O-phosphatidyltransferase